MNLLWILWSVALMPVLANSGGSDEGAAIAGEANRARTQALVTRIDQYLDANDILVALLSRRGKIIDPEKGVSDVDKFDATGMAHTGFVIRTGFGENQRYITLNLVRVRDKERDWGQPRAWSLTSFFIGSGEKDAILMVPAKKVQIQLWNALLKDMTLDEREMEINGQTITRQIIKGGLFEKFYMEEYNLLSDFAFNQTMNCNEHLVKTYLSVLHDKPTLDEVSFLMERWFKPHEFHLSGFKKWMANNMMDLRIKSGERVVNGRNSFRVITVESMVAPVNRAIMGIDSIQVFREERVGLNYEVHRAGDQYIKRNNVNGKPNKTHFDHQPKMAVN